MQKALVTGATGYVGKALLRKLVSSAHFETVATVRQTAANLPSGVIVVPVGDIDAYTDWRKALDGVSVVVHTAGRAHVLKEHVSDPAEEFRRVNVDGTLRLAEQAAAAGVRRFVFISSIGVNGNQTTRPFTADDPPAPQEPYAMSKWEAEQGLSELAMRTGMEICVIRPPLVYGKNAPGNFGRLVRAVAAGVPLPLGAVSNKRSYVALDNLVDLIIVCMEHPAAANEVFLAGDGEDISTTELLRKIAAIMGKPARLLPVPGWMFESLMRLLGKSDLARRLFGSLQVDITKTRQRLGWTPPVTLTEGLRRAIVPVLD